MTQSKRPVHETLKKFFGEDWLEREIGKVKIDGYHNMNPMNLAKMDIHPLIKAVVETQIKMAVLKDSSRIPVGRAETTQSLLHENLSILEDKLDLLDAQRRLRNKNEFQKIEYEIAIAAGYRRMGLSVDFFLREINKRTF